MPESITQFRTDQLRRELERRERQEAAQLADDWPESPVGWWKITTDGDVEGRSTRDLGIHYGHVADLAMEFGGSAMYSLKFSPAEPPEPTPTGRVHIQLDITSGTWDMKKDARVEAMCRWLDTEKVSVRPGQYFGSVLLLRNTEEPDDARAD